MLGVDARWGLHIDYPYRDKSVSLRPAGLGVHDELELLDLAERLEDPLEHLLGDVEVQRSDVEAHGALKQETHICTLIQVGRWEQ